jgi:hypothetical protein
MSRGTPAPWNEALASVQRREPASAPETVEPPESDRDGKASIETENASAGASGDESAPSQKRRGWLARFFLEG